MTRCGQGYRATQGGMLEANHGHAYANQTGAFATTGGNITLDFAELNGNQYDGVLLDGGRGQGSAVRSHDNGASGGGYGIKLINAAYGAFYGTDGLLMGNHSGRYSRSVPTGCDAALAGRGAPADQVPCTPASTLIITP